MVQVDKGFCGTSANQSIKTGDSKIVITNYDKEGETVIDKMPNQNKQSNSDVGEYVDYEEID